MNAVVELKPQGALAASQGPGRMAVAEIIQHVAVVQEVMKAVMKPGVHYGKIPGAGDKMTLLKPGAEVLCMAFRIADGYEIEDLSTDDKIRYRVNCIGTHQVNGIVLGSGLGEASSSEEKYKWRKAVCKEEFDATPANLRRVKFGKGQGGTYKVDQVRTEPSDLANTVLKMANKRAKVAMTINVTACGDMFNQDLEDLDDTLRDHLVKQEEGGQASAPPAAPALPGYSDQDFSKHMVTWRKVIATGKKDVDGVLATIATVGTLTEAQAAEIKAIPATLKKAAEAAAAMDASPTESEIQAKLEKAGNMDDLNAAADLINSLKDGDAVTRLNEVYGARAAQFNA